MEDGGKARRLALEAAAGAALTTMLSGIARSQARFDPEQVYPLHPKNSSIMGSIV